MYCTSEPKCTGIGKLLPHMTTTHDASHAEPRVRASPIAPAAPLPLPLRRRGRVRFELHLSFPAVIVHVAAGRSRDTSDEWGGPYGKAICVCTRSRDAHGVRIYMSNRAVRTGKPYANALAHGTQTGCAYLCRLGRSIRESHMRMYSLTGRIRGAHMSHGAAATEKPYSYRAHVREPHARVGTAERQHDGAARGRVGLLRAPDEHAPLLVMFQVPARPRTRNMHEANGRAHTGCARGEWESTHGMCTRRMGEHTRDMHEANGRAHTRCAQGEWESIHRICTGRMGEHTRDMHAENGREHTGYARGEWESTHGICIGQMDACTRARTGGDTCATAAAHTR